MSNYYLKYIKKCWKKLGYKWVVRPLEPNIIYLISDCSNSSVSIIIKIDKFFHEFWKSFSDGDLIYFTFEEHLLLTETFKFLGWFYE